MSRATRLNGSRVVLQIHVNGSLQAELAISMTIESLFCVIRLTGPSNVQLKTMLVVWSETGIVLAFEIGGRSCSRLGQFASAIQAWSRSGSPRRPAGCRAPRTRIGLTQFIQCTRPPPVPRAFTITR